MHQINSPHSHDDLKRSANRRRHTRHAHGEHVVLSTQWGILTGLVGDLSRTGALVHLGDGLVPVDGDDVDMRLADGRHIAARIAWAGDDTVGLQFDRPLPCIEDVLWLEQRSDGYSCAFRRL